MVTSRPVPQQTAQILSPLAGQKRSGLRFSQIEQDTNSPLQSKADQQNTRCVHKRQNYERSPAVVAATLSWAPQHGYMHWFVFTAHAKWLIHGHLSWLLTRSLPGLSLAVQSTLQIERGRRQCHNSRESGLTSIFVSALCWRFWQPLPSLPDGHTGDRAVNPTTDQLPSVKDRSSTVRLSLVSTNPCHSSIPTSPWTCAVSRLQRRSLSSM